MYTLLLAALVVPWLATTSVPTARRSDNPVPASQCVAE